MSSASHSPSFARPPGIWRGVGWALAAPPTGGGSRLGLALRAAWAVVTHPAALHRWMGVAHEMHSRGLAPDLPGDFLRAVRPYVNRGTGVAARCTQLIDHADWLETALQPSALRQLAQGEPVVLVDLPPPRGYASLCLRLQRAPAHSPEGELLLSLSLQREAMVHTAPAVDVAVVAFSCFRVKGKPCLVIGGLRGQRDSSLRLSPTELAQTLQGWKPAVLMVRVAQELALFWELGLVGLDPAAHTLRGWRKQLNPHNRDMARRIGQSYTLLWEHFAAQRGPEGWMALPPQSDDNLAAIAQSPEKRARQIRRADYWIRTANLLRTEFNLVLMRADPVERMGRMTEAHTMQGEFSGYEGRASDYAVSSVLDTGPGTLI